MRGKYLGGGGVECQSFWGLIVINQPFLGHLMHTFTACSLTMWHSCPMVCRLGANIPSASGMCAVLIKPTCVITTLWLQSLISSHQFHPSVQCLSALLGSARSHHLPRQAKEITALPVPKWYLGRRTLLHSEGRLQARVLDLSPGPLRHHAPITSHMASAHTVRLLGAEREAAAGRAPQSCPSAEQRATRQG